MIPLSVPNLQGNERALIKMCLDSNWVSSAGSFVARFEDAVRKYSKAKYAVACVNGTSGLFISLKVAGVQAGDEVLVPTLTFIAPVNTVKYLGAEPVFMDCDRYLNLDAGKLSEFCAQECKMTPKGLKNKKTGRIIKAVIPVHVFGNPCDMEAIMAIARKYRLKVIEDATESVGSRYCRGAYNNSHTGTIGDFGVYSFNGNKIITTGGGGMILTRDKRMADKARYLTNQAKNDAVRSVHNEIGYNFRLTNLQAALGVGQLSCLDKFIGAKKHNYESYKKKIKEIPGLSLLGIPDGTKPNYWFYSLIIDSRTFGFDKEQLISNLAKQGIQARPIWYLNHLQKPYLNNQSYRIEKAVWFWKRVVNLPCSSSLTESQVRIVTAALKNLQKRNEKSHGKA